MSARAAYIRTQIKPLNDEWNELKDLPQPTDTEQARESFLRGELIKLKEEHKRAMSNADEAKALAAEVNTLEDDVLTPRALGGQSVPLAGQGEEDIAGKSWFDVMTERKSFQRAVRDGTPIRERIPIQALHPFERKTIPFAVTNPALSSPDVQVINQYTTLTRHPILDLITTIATNRYHIDYLPLTFTNAAAETAWGSTKPVSENAGTILSVTMSTIAHTKSVIRQQLHYIPELRGEVEAEMREGVLRRLEFQSIQGTGVSPLINGVLNQVTQTVSGADLVLQILNAVATVENNGGTVDAIVVNPTDVAALRAYEYLANIYNPQLGPNSFAGYRLVKSSAMPAGRAVVGDWAMAVRLYVGDALRVDSTEALGFNSNIINFRGEMDALVLVIRPWLMVDCAGSAPSPPAGLMAAAAPEPEPETGKRGK